MRGTCTPRHRSRRAAPQLSQPGFPERQWYAAVVPGTVLTTLIASRRLSGSGLRTQQSRHPRIVEPPGLLVPQRIRRARRPARPRADAHVQRHQLRGRGLAERPARSATIKGAFMRGVSTSRRCCTGPRNALAVRVSPPPHPGIPHEQSIAAGPGENGGNLALDGPTFIATEGWDWIPGIRDRNTGLWQDVQLRATGALRLLDPHVVTHAAAAAHRQRGCADHSAGGESGSATTAAGDARCCVRRRPRTQGRDPAARRHRGPPRAARVPALHLTRIHACGGRTATESPHCTRLSSSS